MEGFTARLLGLACGLLLVPPPGWCCLTPAPAAPAPPAPSCCCGHTPAPTPDDQAPRPPRDHSRCGCAERHAPRLDHPQPPAPDAGPVAILPTVQTDAPAQALLVTSGDPIPDPSPPLNVLHCLWLC